MKPYLTIDDLGLDGRTVLLRLDINSPIVNGKIDGTDRIEASAPTVDALAAKGAKVVVLAHQGRKGGDDFTSLREHADVLDSFTKCKVAFVDDLDGAKALAAIDALRPGEAVMLENVRGNDDESRKGKPEELARVPFVQTLAAKAHAFVNDAFSAAHRSQASMVGFPEILPAAAGLHMHKELDALSKAVDEPEQPLVYVLGGAKPEDSIEVMRANFASGKLDTAVLGGLVGELFMVARGYDLGRPTMDLLERKKVMELLPLAKEVLEAYDEGILTPEDVAVKTPAGREDVWVEDLPSKYPVLDIGTATAEKYAEIVERAGSLMMNGPMGLYEEPPFDQGTRAVLEAIRKADAFSLMGGGHTTTAIHDFGMRFEDFGYVSLAGGALMAYLTGEELPAVAALKRSAARTRGA